MGETIIVHLHNDRYEQIKAIVVATFEEYEINTIPIDCFVLAHRIGIQTIPFSLLTEKQLKKIEFCEGEAIMFCINKQIYIFYNDIDNSITRQRFSILHEIGHFVLGHKSESELAKSEADFFARYAIAPIPLIWKLNCLDIIDIKNTFYTSIECSTNIKKNLDNWLIYGGQTLKDYEEKLINLFNLN